MVTRGREDFTMGVGRQFSSSMLMRGMLTIDREWAQRVHVSDGLIIKGE